MSTHVSGIFRLWSAFFTALIAVAGTAPQAPGTVIKLSSEQRAKLHDVVSRVLSQADQVRCKPGRCDVLVANFADKRGNTSILGMLLAEEVSKDDSFAANHIYTTSRSTLHDYLESQRIPSRAFKEPEAARWLAREFSADAVLVGRLEPKGGDLEIELQLLASAFNTTRQSKVERETLSGLFNSTDLAPAEPFGQPREVTIEGEKIPKLNAEHGAGRPEMTSPACMYKPDPPYSESARQSKYHGIVVLQTVISRDGRMLDVQPLIGAPYGLNKLSVDTVSTWKCKPSTIDGKPISVVVPIEISFRLF